MKNNILGLKRRIGAAQGVITVDFSQRINSYPAQTRVSAPFDVAKAGNFHEICKPSAKADGNME